MDEDIEQRLQTPRPVLEELLFNGLRRLREQIGSVNAYSDDSSNTRPSAEREQPAWH